MANANFTFGKKRETDYLIPDGDESRKIPFTVNSSLCDKFIAFYKKIQNGESLRKLTDIESVSVEDAENGLMKKLGEDLRAGFDDLFGDGASDTIFQDVNPAEYLEDEDGNWHPAIKYALDSVAPRFNAYGKAEDKDLAEATEAARNRAERRAAAKQG